MMAKCENLPQETKDASAVLNESPEKKPLNQLQAVNPKTLCEKIKYIKSNITVEPVLACYVISSVLSRLATQNLNLEKACRVNIKYSKEICDSLIARKGYLYIKEEAEVQKLIALIEVWKHIVQTAIPSVLILFMGAWSDRTGKRKICILVPIIGEFLTCMSNLVNTYFFYEIPAQVTMFLEAIFPALTGGWVIIMMGAFSYISDVSSKETRTFRVGLVNLCMTAGWPLGTALSGVLLNVGGYYGVFSISACLYVTSIVYGYFWLKDPPRKNNLHCGNKERNCNLRKFIESFFDIKNVKETLTVAFKKGADNRRLKVILLLFTVCLVYGPPNGEFTIKYLYTRYRYNWDALKYSIYSTFSTIVHGFGALISISLFSRRWKFDDAVLGLISTISKIVGSCGTALARDDKEMYIVVVLETLNATSITALRSIASKLVGSEEQGKITSVFNLVEILTALVFGPFYPWAYAMSLNFFPGAVFLVSCGVTLPAVYMFGWFYNQSKKQNISTTDDHIPETETMELKELTNNTNL